MGMGSKIEWCDATFNPWVGCSKLSAACTNCYAESWAKRTGNADLWRGERRRTSVANWRKPLQWNRERPGTRVFCASLADVFEDHPEVGPWRNDLFSLIRDTPNLTWMLLTKRPEVAARWFEWHCDQPPPNVWMGTTVEDQQRAAERIPHLLRIPARVRFLSCEPVLGPLELAPWLGYSEMWDRWIGPCGCDEKRDPWTRCDECESNGWVPPPCRGLQWVIAGGESGAKARPSHPGWFRSLRDQCDSAGVPFTFKQWGEWAPEPENYRGREACGLLSASGHFDSTDRHGVAIRRLGKAAAGRLLDGRTWDGVPDVSGGPPR